MQILSFTSLVNKKLYKDKLPIAFTRIARVPLILRCHTNCKGIFAGVSGGEGRSLFLMPKLGLVGSSG